MAKASRSAFVIRELERLALRVRETSFFQTLVTLERLLPDGQPLGRVGPPEEERVRLRSTIQHVHPSADVEELSYEKDQDRARLTIAFMGLLGVDSPLPMSYTERFEQVDAAGEDRGRVRAFFDLFDHRLYSLLYRAWRKSRPLAGRGPDARLYDRVLATIGYSGRLGLGGASLPPLREARLKVLRARTAAGLESMLEHRLGYRAEVHQLQARRVALPDHQRTRLGVANSQLGVSLVVGSRLVDRNKFMVSIHARDFEHWSRLLPGGSERRDVDASVDSYLRDPLDFDVRLTLRKEHVPRSQLGNAGHRIGRTTWVGAPKRDFVRSWRGRRVRWS